MLRQWNMAAPPTADATSDRALLSAMRGGDRTALEELYRRHVGWLYLRLSRRCADPAVLEEAVQDTFVAVWRRPTAFRGDGEVAAWLWGIAVRRLIDLLRKRPVLALVWEGPAGADAVVASAEEQVLLGVEYGDLSGALNQLSPELRAVVQATILDGLTSREASRLLGVPAGTVRTRLARAKLQLRGALA